MRVLHVDTGRAMRGGQHQVLLLMSALAGHVEQTLLARPDGDLLKRARKNGNWETGPARLGNILALARKCDVVHAHDGRAHTLAVVSTRAALAVSRRVVYPIGRNWISRWKYSRPFAYLAVSQCVARMLIAVGVPGAKVHVVPDAIEPSPLLWHWRASAPVVALDSDDPVKCKALLRALQRTEPELNLQLSSDLPHALQTAGVFCYLSEGEGLGSAVLLAMSLGVPVVASRTGGLAELFHDGDSGLYVDNRVDQIAAALRKLQSSRDLAERISHNGRARALTHFSVEQMRERTLAVYRSVC